jgi:hypothetical protein
MIPYQLPTGKTVFIKAESLLFMTDLEEQELIANDVGCFINNPFYHSSIQDSFEEEINSISLEEIPEIEDEIDFDI